MNPAASPGPIRSAVARRPLASFFVLAFAATWACWIPLAASGVLIRPGGWPTHMPGLIGPALAAFIVAAVSPSGPSVRDLLRRMVDWRIGSHAAIATLALPILFGVAALSAGAIGKPTPRWEALGRLNGFPDAGPIVLWLLTVFVNGWGEEVGWRGFAIERLRERRGLLGASLLLSPIWALWHVPAFFFLEGYRRFDAIMGAGYLFGLACGSIVLAWVYERSGKSLFAAALFHGTYNLFSASEAAHGFPAQVVTTGIMAAAVGIAISELRHRAGA